MSYTPTTWSAGDTITAAKLNKIEQGIVDGGGALLVTLTYDNVNNIFTANKTAGEVNTAFLGGKAVIFYCNFGYDDYAYGEYTRLLTYSYQAQASGEELPRGQESSLPAYRYTLYLDDSLLTLYATSENDYLTNNPSGEVK